MQAAGAVSVTGTCEVCRGFVKNLCREGTPRAGWRGREMDVHPCPQLLPADCGRVRLQLPLPLDTCRCFPSSGLDIREATAGQRASRSPADGGNSLGATGHSSRCGHWHRNSRKASCQARRLGTNTSSGRSHSSQLETQKASTPHAGEWPGLWGASMHPWGPSVWLSCRDTQLLNAAAAGKHPGDHTVRTCGHTARTHGLVQAGSTASFTSPASGPPCSRRTFRLASETSFRRSR